jgi:hypothetical protein
MDSEEACSNKPLESRILRSLKSAKMSWMYSQSELSTTPFQSGRTSKSICPLGDLSRTMMTFSSADRGSACGFLYSSAQNGENRFSGPLTTIF